ncbi:DMT family transporter [Dactylosporangium sucinum]|uniref:Membrane protein n=1 Tax=Dactylosporangium sucinum TaxID=1424081 RepID=A0A917X861_9ACTN|nr:EamA family transporter [Dactylosporangium sucinum]GGM88509.1 membrane protein [Dactylosporangium sucinum]
MADTIALEAPRDKGVGLVLASQTSVHSGAAVATLLFPLAGPAGVVAVRLVIGAALLLAACRPKLRGYRGRDWALIAGFGFVLALMNLLYYLAIERMPIGPVVTLEVLGPLTLSVLAGKGAARWLWALLALAGVALLGFGGLHGDGFDLIAAGLALAAGACWAGYILFSARTGSRFPKQDGIALALTVSALVALPLGVFGAGAALLDPVILGLGAAVAVLSSVLPYTLELAALRRLPTGTFAVLMSLGPAIAALTAFAIAGQALSVAEIVAIVLVVAASAGAVRSRAAAG